MIEVVKIKGEFFVEGRFYGIGYFRKYDTLSLAQDAYEEDNRQFKKYKK